jgi:hypothetical protein
MSNKIGQIRKYKDSKPFGAERPIYGPYRTANPQTLHFKYLFNKYPYLIF